MLKTVTKTTRVAEKGRFALVKLSKTYFYGFCGGFHSI